jgi:aldehyde dehydrogenase (NAD+)
VHESIREALVTELRDAFTKVLGEDPRENPTLPRMVNRKHFERVMKLIDPGKVILGGNGDQEDLYIEPTLMDGVEAGDAVMQEEVFGPVMALVPYNDIETLKQSLLREPAPLILYIFTGNVRKGLRLARELPSGSAMVNDVILQFINLDSPFGGRGHSGMGNYHGRAGFECFSQQKTIMHKPFWFDLFLKYPPYREMDLRLFRAVLGKSFRNLWR